MNRTVDPVATPPGPVPVREAATVALVRDARVGGGLEVFLQHRVATMQFAAGMSVFPGGGVEPRDYGGTRPWR
ncbi:NUDIX hydrolase, partial [Dietzia sp. CQ4]|nr:NUDIX hydrolase [Dietzia sp. CQ4]